MKMGINPTDKQRLQVLWRQSFARDVLHAGLPMDSPYDDSYLAGIDYKVLDLSDILGAITVKGFYSHVDHLMTNENRFTFAASGASSNVFATAYGGKVELTLNPSKSFVIFTGADANFLGRKGNRERLVKVMNGMKLDPPRSFTDKIWQDSNVDDIGVFAEGKYKFSDYYVFTAGIRSDFVNSSINDPAQSFLDFYGGTIADANETNISGTVSIKYQKPGKQIQLAFGRGTRTASITERYINHFSVGLDPYEYVGNPNLKPEVNNQVEFSFTREYPNIRVGGNLFYSLIEDYIVPVVDENIPRVYMPTTPPIYAKRFINIDEAVMAGFEWFFDYKITSTLIFNTDMAYTYGQNKELNEPLAQVVPLTAHMGFTYKKPKYWLNLNSRLLAAQRRVSLSFMEPETPSFATFDFSIGVEPLKNLTIGASVLNIFDEAYYEHLNFSYTNADTLTGRIFEPGRNFTFKVNYKF